MYTLARRPYQAGATDSHGNTVEAWGDPVDLPVTAIAPGAMDEPGTAGRDLSVIAYTLYCPPGTVASERDRVILDDDEYEIDGRPQDWTTGPWPNPAAGVVIRLKRAEG